MSNPDDGTDLINSSHPVCAVEMESLKNANCEDIDLLSVSCKLAHLSTDAVSECLGLRDSQVQDALKRVSDCHQNYNKAHLLLIKWQEVNGDRATQGALVQCLQCLPEPEIAVRIRDELQKNPSGKYATEIGLQCYILVARGLLIRISTSSNSCVYFWELQYISVRHANA